MLFMLVTIIAVVFNHMKSLIGSRFEPTLQLLTEREPNCLLSNCFIIRKKTLNIQVDLIRTRNGGIRTRDRRVTKPPLCHLSHRLVKD